MPLPKSTQETQSNKTWLPSIVIILPLNPLIPWNRSEHKDEEEGRKRGTRNPSREVNPPVSTFLPCGRRVLRGPLPPPEPSNRPHVHASTNENSIQAVSRQGLEKISELQSDWIRRKKTRRQAGSQSPEERRFIKEIGGDKMWTVSEGDRGRHARLVIATGEEKKVSRSENAAVGESWWRCCCCCCCCLHGMHKTKLPWVMSGVSNGSRAAKRHLMRICCLWAVPVQPPHVESWLSPEPLGQSQTTPCAPHTKPYTMTVEIIHLPA